MENTEKKRIAQDGDLVIATATLHDAAGVIVPDQENTWDAITDDKSLDVEAYKAVHGDDDTWDFLTPEAKKKRAESKKKDKDADQGKQPIRDADDPWADVS